MNNGSKTRGGTRIATMEDIARELGLTKAAVSYALNGKEGVAPKTREAVLEAAQRMGYAPNPHAQRLNSGRCLDTVALFTPSLDLGVSTRKLQIIQVLLSERGLRAPIHVCGSDYKQQEQDFKIEVIQNLRMQRPLAIICNLRGKVPNGVISELQQYQQEGGLVVCYDAPVDLECDQVLFDREHNAHLATCHLLELGHRRIAFFGGWGFIDKERRVGYERALREYNVEARPEWLLWHGDSEQETRELMGSRFDEVHGQKIVNGFLSIQPHCTAACIPNDATAAAFVAELLRRGVRVPHDVSVVGQDDLPLAQYISSVQLTTVSQPVEAIAGKVIELLMQRIEGKADDAPQTYTLRGELIQRHSAAPLPV